MGNANGLNHISIAIPCHRVIRSDGSLCGHGGGLWRKRWLLDQERGHLATGPISDEASVVEGIRQDLEEVQAGRTIGLDHFEEHPG